MFAADFDPTLELHAKMYFRDYKHTVKIRSETHRMTQSGQRLNTSVNEKIEQEIICAADYPTDPKKRDLIVRDAKKNAKLFQLLDEAMPKKVLVFIEQKRDVSNLYKILNRENKWNVGFIHSKCDVSRS